MSEERRANRREAFLKGGDISYLLRVEEYGGVFRAKGRARDALDIFRESGFNCARMRLFLEPDGRYGAREDLAYTLRLAKRVKAAGLRMLLCMHYSDTWADPGHQTKPAAWRDLAFPELRRAVRDYSREVISAFRRQGTLPEMVQVGNEITGGFLWPDGKTWGEGAGGWAQFAELVKAGQDGARSALGRGEEIVFVHHIDNHAKARWHLDRLLAQEAKVEMDVYPPTKEGQRDFAAKLLEVVRAVPGGRGQGVLSQAAGPQQSGIDKRAAEARGLEKGSPVDNVTLFDEKGNALPALGAFAEDGTAGASGASDTSGTPGASGASGTPGTPEDR